MTLSMFVVTHNPTDYPGRWVCRLWIDETPTEDLWVGDSLEEVSAVPMREGLHFFPRAASDDPVIVGTWI